MKKGIAILCMICLSLLCFGCSNTNEADNQNESQSEQNENNQSGQEITYDEYFAEIVSEHAEDLDWTILLMDLKSGEVLGSYGDVNKNFEPGNILKPVVYASLIENGISLEDSVDVSVVEYNGEYVRSKENFSEGETRTVLESMELLNNPATINIWRNFDKTDVVLYDLSSIGVMLDDDISPLLGYKTIVSSKDIAQAYRAFADSEQESDEPFTMSVETKLVINDILKKTFENVCDFDIGNYTPYGVFETFDYIEDEEESRNVTSNFAGYLKEKNVEDENGVMLVVNVEYVTPVGEEYNSEKISEVVNDIFAEYILKQ